MHCVCESVLKNLPVANGPVLNLLMRRRSPGTFRLSTLATTGTYSVVLLPKFSTSCTAWFMGFFFFKKNAMDISGRIDNLTSQKYLLLPDASGTVAMLGLAIGRGRGGRRKPRELATTEREPAGGDAAL
eukprot:SAG11_NODE_8402_length_1019_cov_11.619565_2_plen_128_part_01